MGKQVCSLIKFIENLDGKADKAKLSKLVQNEFGLTKDRSVFLFYFIGIMPKQIIGQVLISMFQDDLRNSTHLLAHWAGRNSRGVAQFSGQVLDNLIKTPNNNIDIKQSQEYLNHLMEL
ncbi:MAG: hypothetical protein LBD41_00230 [Clostridiales Family XIII bacterium]|jgi:hypothetical protein|nr:hypothetical protein [Clostridiales Family XIII bacterium]